MVRISFSKGVDMISIVDDTDLNIIYPRPGAFNLNIKFIIPFQNHSKNQHSSR